MVKPNCPFCFDNDSPLVFGENVWFNVVYNRAPILPGHVLVIPKRHVESIDELTHAELSALMPFCMKVINVLTEVFKPQGFDVTIQDGSVAGQSVSHTHVHIIARYTNDLPNPGDWYPMLEDSQATVIDSFERPKHTETELVQIASNLRLAFNRIV